MSASVFVSREVRDALKKRKAALEVKSIDKLLRALLDMDQDHGDADGDDAASSSSSDEQQHAPRKQRKINVRDALYSLDTVSERPGMIESLTGFDRATVDLLVRRFTEVSICCVFFSVSCCAPPKHPLPAVLLYF